MKEKSGTFKKLLRSKKKPLPIHHHHKQKKLDARTEILRNTAINSFRSDEKPTKQLIHARMPELKVREQKQKQLAALHNKILQMHQMLPVFSDDNELEGLCGNEEDDEEDEDYVEEGEDSLEDFDEEDDEGHDEEEEGEDDDEEDGNGVEDLVDLGDERFIGKANRETNSDDSLENNDNNGNHNGVEEESDAVEATEVE
jgi:hypothetical protein